MTSKRFILLLIILLTFTRNASSQEWEGVALRTSAGMNWRIIPKLSVSAEYQLRTQPNFQGIDRQSIATSVSYKFTSWLSAGTGYSFLASHSSNGTFKPRNRCNLDITGSISFGSWKLSLKEKLQFTNKSYSVNGFEEVQNNLALKNILSVKYSGLDKIVPYASIEARISLNDPLWSYDYNGQTGKYHNTHFAGYKSVYLSRIRPVIGLEWSISQMHSIDFRVLCDFNHSQKIKASSDGTALTSIAWKDSAKLSTSIGYTFSF